MAPPIILSTPPAPEVGLFVAFDCETHLITPENPTPTLISIQISHAGEAVVYGADAESLAEGIERLLKVLDSGIPIVAHNGFYDWAVILNTLEWDSTVHYKVFQGFLHGQLRDSLIRAKLHAIEFGTLDQWKFSLEALVDRYLGKTIEGKHGEDVWRLRYAELEGIPAKEWPLAAYEYARMDPIWVEEVWNAMNQSVGHFHDEAFQTTKAWCLYLAGVRGIRVDPKAVDALEEKIQPIIDECVQKLEETGIYKRECRVDKERMAEWFRSQGIDVPVTAKGAPSFTAKVLDKAASVLGQGWITDKQMWDEFAPEHVRVYGEPKRDMGLIASLVKKHYGKDVPLTDTGRIKTDRDTIESVPELEPLVTMGEFEKVRTTYLPSMRASSTNVLHPSHDPLKATGRNSVSRPNLNNVPKLEGVRECYVASEGHVMCSADYSQAELCSLAQVCIDLFGFSVMAEKINEGVDLHTLLATRIYGDDYEALRQKLKEGDKEAKKKRQNMKVSNFGFPGGMGPNKLHQVALKQYGIEGVTLEDVTKWREQWKNLWEEMGPYFDRIASLTRDGATFTVEQHRSGRRRGDCGYSDGANSYFQGLTADGAGMAVIAFTLEGWFMPESPLFGARLLAFIYDELLCEWPDRGPEGNTEVAKVLVHLMESAMEVFTPDVRATVEPALMERWNKKADPVWDVNGFLRKWEERDLIQSRQ
jgi:hypothetical protein